MTRTIGDPLDLANLAELTDPATEHRPTDPDALAREARALAALGLSVQDIAEALKLTPGSVTALLAW